MVYFLRFSLSFGCKQFMIILFVLMYHRHNMPARCKHNAAHCIIDARDTPINGSQQYLSEHVSGLLDGFAARCMQLPWPCTTTRTKCVLQPYSNTKQVPYYTLAQGSCGRADSAPLAYMVSKRTRALVLLTIQNAGISLLTRHSRKGRHEDLYLPSVAVLSAEVRLHMLVVRFMHGLTRRSSFVAHLFLLERFTQIIKALVSLLLVARDYHSAASLKKESSSHVSWARALYAPLETVLTRWSDLAILLVPSILYAGQNNLLVSPVSCSVVALEASLTLEAGSVAMKVCRP